MRFDEFLFVQHSSGSHPLLFARSHAHAGFSPSLPRSALGSSQAVLLQAGAQEQLPALLSPPTETLWVPERGQGPAELPAKICSSMQSTANIASSSKYVWLL